MVWISRRRLDYHREVIMGLLRKDRDLRARYRKADKDYTLRMNKVLHDAIELGVRNGNLTLANADLREKVAALDSELAAANEELARRRMQDPDQWPSGPIIYSENFAEHGTLGARFDKSMTRFAEMKPDPNPTEEKEES